MHRSVIALALLGALSLNPAVAQDCSGAIQFDDNFATLDPGWGPADEFVKVEDGKLVLKGPDNQNAGYIGVTNSAFAFSSGEFCADATLVTEPNDATKSLGGLTFWSADSKNYYQLLIGPLGEFTLSRVLDGNWARPVPIPITASADVKKGANQTNSLAVRFEGNSVVIFINGKEQTKLKLQGPRGPSNIGFAQESGTAKGDVWTFSNVRVADIE
jgi:hypothetical protein